MPEREVLLTPVQVTAILQVSERTLRGLGHAGKLLPRLVGKRGIRYLQSDVESYIRNLPFAEMKKPGRSEPPGAAQSGKPAKTGK